METHEAESIRKDLKDRAEKLARRRQTPSQGHDGPEVVEFFLSRERYAVELAFVREVYPLREITPLPHTPSFVVGIINVRSRIISVMDLKIFFGLSPGEAADAPQVIILCSEQMELGILCDSVVGAKRIPGADIQPSLPMLTGIRADFLKGVTAQGTALLDGASLLSDKRLIVQSEMEL